jgi:hypothetical protein
MASRDQIEQVIAEARYPSDNPFKLGTKAYWAVQDALFDRFMAGRAAHLKELVEMSLRWGGPTLDGTPESLVPLDGWIADLLIAGWPGDGQDWKAMRGGREGGPARPHPPGLPWDQYYRLVERLGFYYADVMATALPGSKWVCWRAERFNDGRTGEFLVDMGIFPTPGDPLATASRLIGSVWVTQLDPSDPDYEPVRSFFLKQELDQEIRWRREWEERGEPLDFQAVPTGEDAGINRGPYKAKARHAAWKVGDKTSQAVTKVGDAFYERFPQFE